MTGNAPVPPLRRLTSIAVDDLLDSFSHSVNFPADWAFVILYGPNGVGKTKVLELVRAAINMDIGPLESIPFTRLALGFDDKSILVVQKTPTPEDETKNHVQVSLTTVNEFVTYDLGNSPSAAVTSWLIRETPWRPTEGGLWEDQTDGEIAALRDLVERYDLPPKFRRAARSEQHQDVMPDVLTGMRETSPVHLIETQRLLALSNEGFRSRRNIALHYGAVREVPGWSRTVTQYSDHLRNLLGDALANNSRLSQQLDRTFPRRIMESSVPSESSDEEIRSKYQTQNELRARLSRFGLIKAEGDLPLPRKKLVDFEVKALSIYLDDTDQKLATFQSLLEKLELFVSLLDQRFARKTVSIDVTQGLQIRRNDTGETIGAEALSSGEQHELVLVYDLLFRTPAGSTVLIDEPEISLHVAWQQKFLSDVTAIARLSDLRFVVATHSPQIIDKWWNKTSALELD